MSDNQGTPIWRIVLSIVVSAFLIIRLAAKIFAPSHPRPNPNQAALTQLQEMQDRRQASDDDALARRSNEIMYASSYTDLDTLSAEKLRVYKIVKVQKDSLVVFDLKSKIKISKNYFFQNNHDRLLRMCIKTTNGTNILIHEFSSAGHIETRLQRLKEGRQFKDYTQENLDKLRLASYRITNRDTKFNGFAIVFQDVNYSVFFEFESAKLNPAKLRKEALTFFSKNLIPTK